MMIMRTTETPLTGNKRSWIPAWKKTGYFAAAGIMGILLIAGISLTFSLGRSCRETDYLRMMITVTGMLFAAILFIGCCFSSPDRARQRDKLTWVSFLLYLTIFLAGLIDMLEGNEGVQGILTALLTGTAFISTAVHFLFWSYQCASLPGNRTGRYFSGAVYVLQIIYYGILFINLFTHILFVVDASGRISYPGELIELLFFSSFYLIYLLYILPQHCSFRKKLSLAGFAVFPLLCAAFTTIWYAVGVPYTVSPVTFIFLLIAAYVVFICDYLESKELLLEQQVELAEQEKKQTELQTALMLSQIRPHFLYNALTAIRNLCKTDPAEAYTALGSFSDYLRANMNALGGGRMTSFKKELEHIKTYLSLEQMRFGEDLNVEYDIRYQDFSLPSLTVQPIVENAVRHGAVMNENGGRITIRSVRTEEGAVITVTDNGPGFDPSAIPSDGKDHFGLKNVRECLAATGSGELQIDSVSGIGTTVTIRIREEGK